MKKISRRVRWLMMPLMLLGVACSLKYTGPGPLPLTVTVENAGTKGEVRIVRDENYIAHVLGASEEDLYFGAGFAMAQDRFDQLDILRRAAEGTLSEQLGEFPSYKGFNLVTLDILMRTFRFREHALVGVELMDPKSRRILDAFTAGINKYLDEVKDKEMFNFTSGVKPAPWKPEDSLAISELMGLIMTVDCIFEEYYLDRVVTELGPERAQEWAPEYLKDAPIITASSEAANGPAFIESMTMLRNFFNEVVPHPIGSNNWVISGSRTKTGKAILANDPHVPILNMPTFWYHVQLKGAGMDVSGMMFPGFPGFGAGTNGKIAWGLTNVMADYIDLFRERVNPSDPNLYLYQNRWEAFRTIRGVIKIKGKKPLQYSYRMTRHGAVIETGLVGDYKIRDWAPYEVIALRFIDVYLNDLMRGYIDLTHAGDWKEFRSSCRFISAGPFGWNMVYADEKGNIGYQTTADIPMRADNQGYFMHRGWTGEEEWEGYVPFDQLPYLYNPPRGYILTANNRVEPDNYPYYISSSYIPYRAYRINEFLAVHPNTTVEEVMALQADVVDVRARQMTPLILADLESANDKGKYAEVIAELKKYGEQNYQSRIDLAGPTVFYMFAHFLPKETIVDEFGDFAGDALSYSPLAENFVDRMYGDPENIWFDDVRTPQREKRADITRRAMDDVIKWMRDRLGNSPDKWVWGNAHKLTMTQAAGAYVWKRANRKKIIRGPFPYPGNYETVNAAGGMFLDRIGFRVIEGPSSRFIVDFSHPSWFNYSASTGMASNPDDPYYDNLTAKWLKVEYDVMKLDEAGFMRGNKGTVVLMP